jgi:hypothetical protein
VRKIVWLCLLAACAELAPLAENVCGNGVLETGEDCDTFAAAPSTCSSTCTLLCGPDGSCPTGAGCGGDGVCRFGGGGYEEVAGSPWPLGAYQLAAGDVDGDGRIDVVGTGPSGVTVRFGGAGGRLDDHAEVPLALRGLASTGDLNGDGLLDVVAPNDLGTVAFLGSADRTLGAYPFAPFDASLATGRLHVVPVHAGTELVHDVLLIDDSGLCFMSTCDIALARQPLPLGQDAAQLLGPVPVAELDASGARDELAVTFTGATSIWIYESRGITVGERSVQRVDVRRELALPGPAKTGIRFAHLDGDAYVDLMTVVTVGGVDHVAVASGGLLGFGTPAVDATFDAFDDVCSSTVWPLAVGQLNALSDQVVDFVGDRAVCVGLGLLGFLPVAFPASTLPWSEATIADFNSDGRLDVAASVDGALGVDFYLGEGRGRFNPAHVATRFPPRGLRAGDFDGDFVTDLAVIEAGRLAGETGDDVSILFGATDGAPRPPAPMARFPYVEDLRPLDVIVSLSTVDAITDLVVLSREAPTSGAYAGGALLGSGTRRMISPYFAGDGSLPLLTAVMRLTADAFPDILIAAGKLSLFPTRLSDPTFHLLRGSAGGAFRAQDVTSFPIPALEFASGCAVFAHADLAGLGSETLFAFDGAQDVMHPLCESDTRRQDEPRLLTMSVSGGEMDTSITTLPGSFRRPASVDVADLDLDGDPDVIVTFRGDDTGAGAGVVVYESDGATGLDLAGGRTLTGVPSPLAAAALDDRPGQPPSIAVLTRTGIVIIAADGSARTVVALDEAADPSGIVTADLDHDGLADLIVEAGGRVSVYRGLD